MTDTTVRPMRCEPWPVVVSRVLAALGQPPIVPDAAPGVVEFRTAEGVVAVKGLELADE